MNEDRLNELFLYFQSSSKQSDCGNPDDSLGGKDDDDDDDNDDDDKLPVGQDIDPERLKAFNVRHRWLLIK